MYINRVRHLTTCKQRGCINQLCLVIELFFSGKELAVDRVLCGIIDNTGSDDLMDGISDTNKVFGKTQIILPSRIGTKNTIYLLR